MESTLAELKTVKDAAAEAEKAWATKKTKITACYEELERVNTVPVDEHTGEEGGEEDVELVVESPSSPA
ncbi:hypothetical protein LIER_35448 [Lithospermum erythrorhizon]|uniref:Uncharacterized protein n=1 Tax=Lithospermum erythrorhizon TaxID=34254 RepID=A0AAV3NQV5_LITER